MNQEKEISKFTMLGRSIFKKDLLEIDNITKSKLAIENIITKLLENEKYDIVMEYAASGYELTVKQEEYFEKKLRKIETTGNIRFDLDGICLTQENRNRKKKEIKEMFLTVIRKEITPPNYYLKSFFNIMVESSLKGIKSETIEIQKIYENFLNVEELRVQILKNLLDKLVTTFVRRLSFGNNKNEKINFIKYNITNPLDMFGKLLLKGEKIDVVLQLLDDFKLLANKYLDSDEKQSFFIKEKTIEIIKKMINEVATEEIEETKKHINIIYLENNINKLIIEERIKKISKTNLDNLPDNCKDILKDIRKNYALLHEKEEIIPAEGKLMMKKIWNEILPKLLEKYLYLDDDLKQILLNVDEKPPAQLLLESLNSINENLEQLREETNQNQLNSISVMHRYLKK